MSGGGGGKVRVSKGEKELLKIAQEQWGDYQERYVPVENKFLGMVDDIGKREKFETGRANADTAQAFDGGRRQGLRRAMLSGAAPGSGRTAIARAGATQDRADAGGRVMSGASFANTGRRITGLGKAVSLGRGISDLATLSTRDSAQQQASFANAKSRDSLQRWGQNMDLAGTAIGAGVSYGYNEGWFDPMDSGTANRTGPTKRYRNLQGGTR